MAKKKSSKSRGYSFNVLDDDNADFVEATEAALSVVRAARKNQPTGFKSMASVRQSMVPFREFMFQWLFGTYGLVEGTVFEIIGGEGLGKTTLAFWLMGGAMLAGIPCSYQGTEAKTPNPEWLLRALHPNPKVAKKMLARIGVYENVHVLDQMHSNLEDWIDQLRGNRKSSKAKVVPKDTPILMVVDTMSKLMAPGEAAGNIDYKDYMSDTKKRAKKGVNEGTNLEHAKWHASWCRKLPNLLKRNNVILVLISHQNAKIDMGGGGKSAPVMSKEIAAAYNKTKLGGAAINQNAAMQLILSRKGLVKNGVGAKIGKTIQGRAEKNSYGPENRVVTWDIINEGHMDTKDFLSPCLVFDNSFANFMAEQKYLGTTVSRKRYTSEFLGVVNATAAEYAAAFGANPEARVAMGKALGINGYNNIVGEVLEEEKGAS